MHLVHTPLTCVPRMRECLSINRNGPLTALPLLYMDGKTWISDDIPTSSFLLEVDFEDIAQITHSNGVDDMQPEKLTIELHRPPRFFKENPPSAVSGGSQEVNYVYTTDFTNGQASTESRHVLLFDPGAITRETAKMLTGSGIRLISEGVVMPESAAAVPSRGGLLRGAGGVHATSAHLRQPPTSSPRLDAILLQDQLKREMRERQARYTGICPVRIIPARYLRPLARLPTSV